MVSGNRSRPVRPDSAPLAELLARPADLGQVIDALVADPALVGPVDPDRIAAIGHSLGGWTVTALAGAAFDPALLDHDCQTNPGLRACQQRALLGLDERGRQQMAAAGGAIATRTDKRLRAFVALDPGLVRSFTRDSLRSIAIPSLVLAAGSDDPDLPRDLESGYLVRHLDPGLSRYDVISGASHFSFVQLCQPQAAMILATGPAAERALCLDGGDRERADIHRALLDLVIPFLERTLAGQSAKHSAGSAG